MIQVHVSNAWRNPKIKPALALEKSKDIKEMFGEYP
jgi:hypothetical protein